MFSPLTRNGSLERSEPCPYHSLQRTEILYGIRIEGGRIEKLELWADMRKRIGVKVREMFCQWGVNLKK